MKPNIHIKILIIFNMNWHDDDVYVEKKARLGLSLKDSRPSRPKNNYNYDAILMQRDRCARDDDDKLKLNFDEREKQLLSFWKPNPKGGF